MQSLKKSYPILILVLLLGLVSWRYFAFKEQQKQAGKPVSKVLGVYTGTGDFPSQVIGETNTQAILTYNAPTTTPCSVVVSQSSGLTPVINDVNPTLYTNSNLDNRTGSVTSSTYRVFVIGKRSADVALDGNRYSRALQAYTPYYYQITCGSAVATGNFSTQTLPSGMTYSDTIPSSGDASSTPAWPSIGTDRSQQIIDPQTGVLISRLSLASDNSGNGYFPSSLSLGSFGDPDICNPTLVADNTGAMGYHCMITGVLFWINPTTGDARPVGIPTTNYDNVNFGGTQVCGTLDMVNPNRFYCINNDINGVAVLVSVNYTGQNTFFAANWPTCTGNNAPCSNATILTPEAGGNDFENLVHNFDNNYPVNFNINGYFPGIKSVQNGKLLIDHVYNYQDSYAWYIVFDPGNNVPVDQASSTASVIAAKNSYKNYPIRWCSDHTLVPIGNQDWMLLSANNLKSNTNPGFGSFTSHIVSGNLPSTTTACPANSFGAIQCTDVVVDGEPCNADQTSNISTSTSCGIPTASYLQDAQPGDIFGIDPTNNGGGRGRNYNEFVQLIAKNGNTWTVARGLNQTTVASHSTGVLDEMCTAHDTVQQNYDLGNWFWDYINDPHGLGTPTGTPGTTIIYDKNSSGTHSGFRPGKYVDLSGDNRTVYYKLRTGSINSIANDTGTLLEDVQPAFSGVYGIGFPNTVDGHPTPFVNDQYFYDARPLNSGFAYNSNANNLGGGVYQYPVGAIILHRKQQPTLAHSNLHILKDISGPGSDIISASDYSYCVVENAGECHSGSLPTEVYAKSSTATESDCPFPGVANPGWNVQSICIGDNSAYNQAIAQIGANVDPNGKNGRMITHGLTDYNRQDVFWNARGLPDNSNMLFSLPTDPIYGNGSGQLFMAKLPPFTVDGILRNDFIQVPLTIASSTDPSAVSATVSFGYHEFGQPTDFYCTSRKEACVKGSQSGNSYDFASASITPVACSNGCTINVPLLPERVAYLQVNYQNASGTTISTLPLQAVAVDSPYNITSASYVPIPTPTPSATPTPTPSPTPVQGGGGGGGGGGYYTPTASTSPVATNPTTKPLTVPAGLPFLPNPLSLNLPYSSGSLINSDGTIYYISENIKIPFTSLKAFLGLGYSLKNVVKGDTSSYTLAEHFKLSSATQEHAWGSWLSYGKYVYYSTAQGFIPVPSQKIFTENGGKLSLVVKMSSTEIKLLKKHTLSAMVSGDERVGQ